MQFAFYFDQTRCSTCATCTVACKDWHFVKPGPVAYRKIHAKTEKGEFPNVDIFPLVYSCNHCDEPACVRACANGAITKNEENGLVLINRRKCTGLNACVDACPYGAPQRADTGNMYHPGQIQEPVKDPVWQVDHPAQKCDACIDRLNAGKVPVCVIGCPQRALDFGPLDQIRHKYPFAVRATEVADVPSDISAYAPEGTGPNLYIRPKVSVS